MSVSHSSAGAILMQNAIEYRMEQYDVSGIPARGVSYSTLLEVLHCAAQQLREGRWPLSRDLLVDGALRAEWSRANGYKIATGDVYPIVYGGAVTVSTLPEFARFESIPVSPQWISEHVGIAIKAGGQTHSVRNLLPQLFQHRHRADFVRRISCCADAAAHAVRSRQPRELAGAINDYVQHFDEWCQGTYVSPRCAEFRSTLASRVGRDLLATKPCGAGAAESICYIVDAPDTHAVVARVAQTLGWHTQPVELATGLSVERLDDGGIRVASPHRLDFVAAADLSRDRRIGSECEGLCCSIAIEPRCSVTIHSTKDFVMENHSADETSQLDPDPAACHGRSRD